LNTKTRAGAQAKRPSRCWHTGSTCGRCSILLQHATPHATVAHARATLQAQEEEKKQRAEQEARQQQQQRQRQKKKNKKEEEEEEEEEEQQQQQQQQQQQSGLNMAPMGVRIEWLDGHTPTPWEVVLAVKAMNAAAVMRSRHQQQQQQQPPAVVVLTSSASGVATRSRTAAAASGSSTNPNAQHSATNSGRRSRGAQTGEFCHFCDCEQT